MGKNIVICFDGTWNTSDSPLPTNVVRTANMISSTDANGGTQIVYYDAGVGSGQGAIARRIDGLLGGVFGVGLMNNIEHAYRFLVFNYAPGDKIYIFGFSRGAFSARSLGGLLRSCGILKKTEVRRIKEGIALYKDTSAETHPDAEKSCIFRRDYCVAQYVSDEDREWRRKNVRADLAEKDTPLTIAYLGVWDTVGALGVPPHILFANYFNRSLQFHDEQLSSIVSSARHAVAIDERRRVFDATLWRNIEELNQKAGAAQLPVDERPYVQQWFPGDHGSVGGGGDVIGLAATTLVWMLEGATRRGLSVDQEQLDYFRREADYRVSIRCMQTPSFGLTSLLTRKSRNGPSAEDLIDVSHAARARYKAPAEKLANTKLYRPRPLRPLAKYLDEVTV